MPKDATDDRVQERVIQLIKPEWVSDTRRTRVAVGQLAEGNMIGEAHPLLGQWAEAV
jgi:hypothetical protein